MQQHKQELRRLLRAQRMRLSPAEQAAAADALCRHLAATHFFRTSTRIACYLPNDGEIDPFPLIDRIWSLPKRCYLPVLAPVLHNRLWFAEVTPDTPLAPNRLGILEPQVPAREMVRAQALDLVLMPLVGFDRAGNRLGMGGGFYDRSLEFLHHRGRWHKPRLMGLAHHFQQVDSLAINAWDVPMQAVATDAGVQLVGERAR